MSLAIGYRCKCVTIHLVTTGLLIQENCHYNKTLKNNHLKTKTLRSKAAAQLTPVFLISDQRHDDHPMTAKLDWKSQNTQRIRLAKSFQGRHQYNILNRSGRLEAMHFQLMVNICHTCSPHICVSVRVKKLGKKAARPQHSPVKAGLVQQPAAALMAETGLTHRDQQSVVWRAWLFVVSVWPNSLAPETTDLQHGIISTRL